MSQKRGSSSRAATARFSSFAATGSQRDVRAIITRARSLGRTALDEFAAKQVLAAYGIDVPRSERIANADEIDQALGNLTPPLVLKVISPDVLHKSDIGGVRLNLLEGGAIRRAIRDVDGRMRSLGYRIEGFILEEMASGGHEVVIGGLRDPSFGQLVMFGLGGVFVEVLRDVSFRICPISRLDAAEMIHEIRGAPILAGARGGSVVPEAMLIEALMAVGGEGGLLLDLGDEIAEVDINPLIASDTRIIAVDARLILAKRSGDAG